MDDTEFQQGFKRVRAAPMLDNAPVPNALNVYAGQVKLAMGCFNALPFAPVRPGGAEPGHHQVALRHLPLNRDLQIGIDQSEGPGVFLEPGDTSYVDDEPRTQAQ